MKRMKRMKIFVEERNIVECIGQMDVEDNRVKKIVQNICNEGCTTPKRNGVSISYPPYAIKKIEIHDIEE